MSESIGTVLLVCNAVDRAEIEEILAGGGSRDGLVWQDGGDQTLACFEALQPEVVVLSADLETVDSRDLLAIMRTETGGDTAKFVFIGASSGPMRTALDAVGLEIDRFVTRPLAANALVFAVRTCLEEASRARGRMPSALGQKLAQRVESMMNSAIDDFVQNAMDSLPKSRRGRSARETLLAAVPPPPTADPAPDASRPGGAFARELRRKMSDMAERLFPGQRLKESEPTTHSTDIDLASFGMDTVTGLEDDEPGFETDGDLSATLITKPDHEPEPAEPVAGTGDVPEPPRADEAMKPNGEAALPRPVIIRPASAPRQRVDELLLRGVDEQASKKVVAFFSGPQSDSGVDTETPSLLELDLADDGLAAQGSIRRGEADAAILLERMYRRRFTGRIEFRREEASKEILFDTGRPVFASSNLMHDRMGELLHREGKITTAQYDRVQAVVLETGRRMGEVLIDMGWLKRRELLPVVRRHIEDIVYSLFAWDAGQYAITEGDFAASERIRIARHPAAMVLEGVRRKFDLDTLQALLGSPDSIIEVVDDRKLKTVMSVADLNTAERKVIAGFDGERSLAEVQKNSSIDLVEVYQLAYGLVVWGAAQSLRRGQEGKLGEEPALIGETDLAIDRQRVLAKYALVIEADYFALLGVRRDATSFEVKRAYEVARRDYAGESFPPEVRAELAGELAEIAEVLEEAFLVLHDDHLRTQYLGNLLD